ncbi:hypothetical protein WOLCODRAFT_158788 [Wolfiporia cocos MD-104 SS10]|uniref:Uncharacterized protein n=1 Tax=Wolfiporia cocos (strain MD-104) TaxID=742152 RepID=A0A2H3JNC5_WOLCO|nr:hypothetical protein WOLCODRAFT_158788 [Wolfiporia cocos MD-104 SS10]
MVSYSIINGSVYNTHKVAMPYRPAVGKHAWPRAQTCLMDYLRVVFSIRVRGSVITFNSIPPHVRPSLNVNHTAYIKYYGEDSTRNHISWYPWDKYATAMPLAEIICLYGDVHWYMDQGKGPSRAVHTPTPAHSATGEEENTAPEPPRFGSLPDLLPEWRHVRIQIPEADYPPNQKLRRRLTQHLAEMLTELQLELATATVTEARGEAASYMHANLANMRDWVEAQTEPVWNQANRLRMHNLNLEIRVSELHEAKRLRGMLDELVQKRIDTLESDVKVLQACPATQGASSSAEVTALINRIDQLEQELNALKNAAPATTGGTTTLTLPRKPTKPPKFSGPKDSISSKEWIQKMGMYFADTKVTLEEDKPKVYAHSGDVPGAA